METQAIFSAVLALLVAGYFFFYKIRVSGKRPPSPWGLPLLGHLTALAGSSSPPHAILYRLSKKFGNIFYLRLGYRETFVISSAKIAQEILKANDRIVSSRPTLTFAQIILPDDIVFARYGDRWRNLRKICTLELFTVRRVASFAAVRQEETAKFLETLSQHAAAGSAVDMSHDLTLLVMNIMQTIIFGKSRKFDPEEFIRVVHRANELAGNLHIGDYIPWLKRLDFSISEINRLADSLHSVLQSRIDAYRSGGGKEEHDGSFLDVLLSLGTTSDLTTRCIMLDAISAGVDTTATAIEWAITDLVRHPEIMKKAQKELDDAIPRSAAIVTEAEAFKLEYLAAIVKESLRLHPPAPLLIPRESVEECKMEESGYTIPAKSQVIFNVYAMGRDPDVWDKPLEFIPERMEGGGHKPELTMTFGHGRRSCPGMNLGMAAVHLVLANLLHKFNWSVPGGKALDVDEGPGFTLLRARPLELIPCPRVDPIEQNGY